MNDQDKKLYYPDLAEANGLPSMAHKLFEPRIVGVEVLDVGGWGYAKIKLGERSSQISLALGERCFLFDFWQSGKKLAKALSSNLQDVEASIERWLTSNEDVEALMKAFPFVRKHKPMQREDVEALIKKLKL